MDTGFLPCEVRRSRHQNQLAPSAFLSSAATSSDLVHHILPSHLLSAPLSLIDEALMSWSDGDSLVPPAGSASRRQRPGMIPRRQGCQRTAGRCTRCSYQSTLTGCIWERIWCLARGSPHFLPWPMHRRQYCRNSNGP